MFEYKNIRKRISVNMIVYNGGAYLEEAIDSILNQTFQNFEFIIVDDASTDNSVQIIQSYQDSRIQLLRNEKNEGIIYSRNKALAASSGEYIAVLDADDMSYPERLGKQLSFLDSHPHIGVIASWFETLDQKRRKTLVYTPTEHEHIQWSLLFKATLHHSTVMFRKDLILNVGGYGQHQQRTLGSDHILWTVLISKTRFAILPEFLGVYRLHRENITKYVLKNNRVKYHRVDFDAKKAYFESVCGEIIPEEVFQFIYHRGFTKSSLFNALKALKYYYYSYSKFISKYNLKKKLKRKIQFSLLKQLVFIYSIWVLQRFLPKWCIYRIRENKILIYKILYHTGVKRHFPKISIKLTR